ncbi:hypothetical protein ABTZ78_23710 [Streptomyces bauhiniae]
MAEPDDALDRLAFRGDTRGLSAWLDAWRGPGTFSGVFPRP